MIFHPTTISGVYGVEPELRSDERGYFTRIFCKKELNGAGIDFPDVVQVNQSLTKKRGTIRGMHYQIAPCQEDKIIQCVRGAVYDVALDLREHSPTFGKWTAQELSAENRAMLLVPKGCAHGFQTLRDDCVVQYMVSTYYAPDCERGVRWNDPLFRIAWPIADGIISEKDAHWPLSRAC